MLIKGDLVRIPAHTVLIQDNSELSIIDKYKYTKSPEIGIFISYARGEDAKVFINNQYWLINTKDISFVGVAC